MRTATFSVLFGCFLVAQGVTWYLYIILLVYVVRGVREEWIKRGQVRSVSRNNRVKALSLCCATCCITYQTMLGRCFLQDFNHSNIKWQTQLGRPYHTVLILLCMLSFALLFCVSLLRLRFVFAHTVFTVSAKKTRCYLTAISIHALIEFASIFTDTNHNQWLLWIIYDCMLSLLSTSLCYDITTRLMRVVTMVTNTTNSTNPNTISGSVYKPSLSGDSTTTNPTAHNGGRASPSALESSLRYGTFSLHQIQLFRVASKLTVLAVTLNLAALLWTLSPVILLITGSQTHGILYEIAFALEVFNHLLVFTVATLVCLLSFSAGDRIYNWLCSTTGHACAMTCFLSTVQARLMEERMCEARKKKYDNHHRHRYGKNGTNYFYGYNNKGKNGGVYSMSYEVCSESIDHNKDTTNSSRAGGRMKKSVDSCNSVSRKSRSLAAWNQIDHSQAFRLSPDILD